MSLRRTNLAKLPSQTFDVLIIGGGINGAVSAAALAGKGARVALIDRGDFAGCTSQESSNLAWGGIKYLENFELALVRKLCRSRNHLMRHYPSTVHEIRFLTTVPQGFRRARDTLWAGAWLYWALGNGLTRTPERLSPTRLNEREPIIDPQGSRGGLEYSDAFFYDNDARFTFNFIRGALNSGCIAVNYVASLGAFREQDIWRVQARDQVSGEMLEIRSRMLINAAGPFVDEHNRLTGQTTEHRHVLSKGVHLIVDQLTPEPRVLAFLASDGRLFLAIPMGRRHCIGTTDTPVDTPYTQPTEADRRFILDNINARLRLSRPLSESDIIAERCGVRPLAMPNHRPSDDGFHLSRKHVIEVNRQARHLSIFGGKLTDCLNVGNEVASASQACGIKLPFEDYQWYGEPNASVRNEFLHQAKLMELDSYTAPESSEPLTSRLWRRYGAQAIGLLEDIRQDPRQAEVLIHGTEYIRCELQQAARREMVVTLEDFLRRRSKIALMEPPATILGSSGLVEACKILFGDEADTKLKAYRDGH